MNKDLLLLKIFGKRLLGMKLNNYERLNVHIKKTDDYLKYFTYIIIFALLVLDLFIFTNFYLVTDDNPYTKDVNEQFDTPMLKTIDYIFYEVIIILFLYKRIIGNKFKRAEIIYENFISFLNNAEINIRNEIANFIESIYRIDLKSYDIEFQEEFSQIQHKVKSLGIKKTFEDFFKKYEFHNQLSALKDPLMNVIEENKYEKLKAVVDIAKINLSQKTILDTKLSSSKMSFFIGIFGISLLPIGIFYVPFADIGNSGSILYIMALSFNVTVGSFILDKVYKNQSDSINMMFKMSLFVLTIKLLEIYLQYRQSVIPL